LKQYLDLLKLIVDHGEEKTDRTGTGTLSVFGHQMRFPLKDGFPAVTTKKLAWKSVVSELLWFLEGSTDERRLAEIHYGKPREELIGKKTIWTANADEQGKNLGYENTPLVKELGPVYGSRWRDCQGIDQVANILIQLEENPDSRRHIISAWDVANIDRMALPPCHTLFQFYVCNGKLSCQLYQRSADVALGTPFNIASYALLTHMFAQILDLDVGDFVYTLGDAHVYTNHVDGVKEQLDREPLDLPRLVMPQFTNLQDLLQTTPEEYILEGYRHHEPIKFKMAV